MPQRNERENHDAVDDHPFAPAQRDVNVPRYPRVVAPVPASPEPERRVVVSHASEHVFGWIDAIGERPQSEKSPWE